MKRLMLASLLGFFSLSTFAQSNAEDIDMIQAIYGKEKKAIVNDFIMPPDDTKKAAFWDLYDKYEAERKALGKNRISLLEKYVNAYDSLTDKSTDDVMKQSITLQKSVDGLIATYYEKIKKAVGVKQAAQFYHIESYLLSATRVYILGNMPFIESLEKMPAAPKAGQ
jgi:hypothetical protein